MKFCLFTSGRSENKQVKPPRFVFFAHGVKDLEEPIRQIELSADDIELLNPNTRTCPIFRSRADAELTKAIYRRVPILLREACDVNSEENPWGIRFKQGLFNMASDSGLFRTRDQLESAGGVLSGNKFRNGTDTYLPLYEAKMAQPWDHRSADVIKSATATIRQNQPRNIHDDEKQNPERVAIPFYWVAKTEVLSALKPFKPSAALMVTKVTSPTNARTCSASILPLAGYGDSCLLILFEDEMKWAEYCGLLGSILSTFILDYAARQKLGGVNFNFYIQAQLPILPSNFFSQHSANFLPKSFFISRILELVASSSDMTNFSKDLYPDGKGAIYQFNPERRFAIQCELDSALFHYYLPSTLEGDWTLSNKTNGCPRAETLGELTELKRHFPTPRDAVAYILDTFPIVRRKDEEAFDGDYRTKRVILEIYDAMQEAIRTGKQYQTRLDPPPGPPTNPDGTFASLPDWEPGTPKPANWPSHIHPPRGCHESH